MVDRPVEYGWPAAMKRATAAAYLDISIASFEREIVSGRMPGPFILGGREHWSKQALDAALDRLSGNDFLPVYLRKLYGKYGWPDHLLHLKG